MPSQQMYRNEYGEPLGIETHYDDGYDFEPYDFDEYGPDDWDEEPDTTQDGFPFETDLGDEWL
jgi:hypothetical protein